ncbi:hypothetical protein CBFG_04705 [Clostridiales bacterium 1_7_47FAA]|nr:hypothetical protein CBFG_04705 [Clostridiales bacterium 1_7_47FAA]
MGGTAESFGPLRRYNAWDLDGSFCVMRRRISRIRACWNIHSRHSWRLPR